MTSVLAPHGFVGTALETCEREKTMSHKRDSLVPIGKASSGLSVKVIRSTSPQARHQTSLVERIARLEVATEGFIKPQSTPQ